mmetsp:Transcript_15385/g.26410  ORF Transcript_15385/g.26410 Transcript_15385/m.26410 type:complete len:127 (-) Transcript_15385:317-697(-)|eukprot:CAMPEP_0196659028 /NCGR_PEP_ID=MMETSP1086-20130531/32819_1 /TAXON_ID=77921 /ORGANISM="Cyanoptyche  gloeocystis , Strain SAG4.97" /LENGTH=126 /DNA_ID=CAMNT_0041992851 /DNA_START=48 /DNA_END=428 /DNA_ORIENTATION=-
MKLIQSSSQNKEQVSHNVNIEKFVYLRNGELPHVTQFARSIFRPGQVASKHSHADMNEVFLVIAGEAVVNVNGSSHVLKALDCLVVERGEFHEIRNPSTTEDLHLVYFGLLDQPTASVTSSPHPND